MLSAQGLMTIWRLNVKVTEFHVVKFYHSASVYDVSTWSEWMLTQLTTTVLGLNRYIFVDRGQRSRLQGHTVNRHVQWGQAVLRYHKNIFLVSFI